MSNIRRYVVFLTALAVVGFALPVFAQKEMSIAEVQGDKAKSAVEGQQVKVRGIVTAITRNGIFVQTPDDKADSNPQTSEGIYVYLGQNAPFGGAVGDLVEATGTVQEFMPRSEKYGFT